MALIIVESPTKARTFNRILKSGGSNYFVFATMCHFRDLPHDKMAIDFQHDFQPEFEIMKNKAKIVMELRKLAKENDEIILATDPDREGESISYHVAYILGYFDEKWPVIEVKKDNLKRIVFHEITANALKEALDKPEILRLPLVKAQLVRRILDRIVGYELSPLLWKKTGKNWLSAGRVQTVALRLIVEREKEIEKFKTEEYCQIYGLFDQDIKAKLVSKQNIAYENKYTLKLFAGEYTYSKTSIKPPSPDGYGEPGQNSETIKKDIETDEFIISDIDESIQTKYPPPPFTTSLLQQDAFHKYGFSSKMTMRLAQDLYEQGLITYHRTDSFNLSTQFVFACQKYIKETYGNEYALEKPRGYKTKSRMAQEAHEAIRPTRFNAQIKAKTINHNRLYQLIFNRAISTQMKEAQLKIFTVTIRSKKEYEFMSETSQVLFDGFLKLLNPEFIKNHVSAINLQKNSLIKLIDNEMERLTTKPPYRYNEATLIKELEERGIGRPSTYAPIISLIQEKNYVEKEFRYFKPTKLGTAICDYLSSSFPDIFSLDFTATMEDDLDLVAEDQKDFIQLLKDFDLPFHKELDIQKNDSKVIEIKEEVDEKCPKCNSPMVVRFSRFGKFLACSRYPDCKTTKSFLKPIANKKCPKCQQAIVIKFTKSHKRFYGCSSYPKCDFSSWTLAGI